MEQCPGCLMRSPPLDGPTHRYVAASPRCWYVFTTLLVAAPARSSPVLTDAYMAQHPDGDSPQAIQSAAIHLLTLHGYLNGLVGDGELNAFRVRAVEAGRGGANRYAPMKPRPDSWVATIADVAEGSVSPEEYAVSVYEAWMRVQSEVVRLWWRGCEGDV